MPPEKTGQLVAIDFEFDEKRGLLGQGKRAYPSAEHLIVSWYSGRAPTTYRKICNGVAYVKKSTLQNPLDDIADAIPTKARGRYVWRDSAGRYGTMVIMILPMGNTIVNPNPLPEEAKNFQDRIALFWLLWPSKDRASISVEIEWGLRRFSDGIDNQVEEINKRVRRSRQRNDVTDYDVALSFAGEDRAYVEQVAENLQNAGINVFYDKYEQTMLWGKNLYDHLSEVYGRRAKYTVVFISKHYRDKLWTNFERQTAQARAFTESHEYILPARFDDTEIPGLLPTIAYVPLKQTAPDKLAEMIIDKLQSVQ